MPYLRITCPALEREKYAAIAAELTQSVNDLFYNPRGRVTQEELKERTTVHFVPYSEGELFVGGTPPAQRGHADVTLELSDWYMSIKQQRKVATQMTPLIARLFDIPATKTNNINFRFHAYPPTDFAVGGRLLSDLIPLAGQLAKRFFG